MSFERKKTVKQSASAANRSKVQVDLPDLAYLEHPEALVARLALVVLESLEHLAALVAQVVPVVLEDQPLDPLHTPANDSRTKPNVKMADLRNSLCDII